MAATIERAGTATGLALPISGMTCAGCAGRVERALRSVPGVREANVNLALERADLVGAADAASLAQAVRDAGYRVDEQVLDLRLAPGGDGASVERVLRRIPGVIGVTIAPTGAIEVQVVSGAVETADLAAAAGGQVIEPTAVEVAPARSEESRTGVKEGRQALAAALLTAPLLLPMSLGWIGFPGHLPPWLELALATPVQFVIGARFYRGAWRALRARSGNMDLLVALGTSAAYLYSLWLVLRHGAASAGGLYFEAAAVVITLVLLGKWLEARAKRGASAALRGLMALRPETATVMRSGDELVVPTGAVRVGDSVLARPGERIAVDGSVLEGHSEVDEALLTGESMPVAKGPGDPVVAGSINGLGLLKLRAERLGRDTTLARITRLVEQAQIGKAPIQRLVDRVSGVFVSAVTALALATFLGWLLAGGGLEQALVAAISVLVIACPCALGLATPTALVAGTGVAARAGILIRDIETLERAYAVRTMVLDKTGTLTRGEPEVSAVLVAPGIDEAELVRLSASAQRGSEHPLGRAMVALARARGVATSEPAGFVAQPGRGLAASVEGRRVLIGTAALLAAEGVATEPLTAPAESLAAAGDTLSWVAADGRLLGVVGFRDALRDHAAAAVGALRARGIELVLLSGDHPAAAARVAAELGIVEVRAPIRPEGKAAEVERLRAGGRAVAMVGDGVNDAPALAAADVGIAMGTGADVALDTAGITLMRPDPLLVPAALDIAQRTRAKIRQNLFWAFGYNLVALPLAALGLLTPALAGAAMALSSVSVVANALTLRRWRPDMEVG